MQHIDRYTKLDQLDLSEIAHPIIEAAINNRRIFSEDDDLEEADLLTDGIKYGVRNKTRARYRPLDTIDTRYNKEKAKDILELLGYIDPESDVAKSLKFQLDSWRRVDNQNGLRMARGEHKGLMITAPTGFGKTACFMGGTIDKIVNGNYDRVIFVYPSRALLEDQLSRVLSIVHRVNNDTHGQSIAAGLWYGNQPYYVNQISEKKYGFVNNSTRGEDVLKVAKHWNEDLSDRSFTFRELSDDRYRIENAESGDYFAQDEFVINRGNVRDNRYGVGPEILLTTLESLENFGMKPHYDIVKNTDAFVFDEIHQYTGLRGAHASQIISNIKQVLSEDDQASLFIGSSATVESPEQFGNRIFGFDQEEDLDVIRPPAPDRIESREDLELEYVPEDIREKGRPDQQYFYFMLTPEGGPGVASQYIQHAMMVGHALSRPVDSDSQQQMLSFIQSKSQIQSLAIQLNNADTERQLWKHHRQDDDPGNWDRLADETGHRFYSNTLDIKNIHADSDTALSELSNADVIQSTSFLEVGIDIGNLKYISQYRPPESISAFKQRAGRAGREPGMDAHTFTLLSQYGGDSNFYYRAGQFLDRDITTPFKRDNKVAQWIHDTLYDIYEALNEEQRQSGDWTEQEEEILENYFKHSLQWERFASFLLHTKPEFEELFDWQTAVDSGLVADADDDSSDSIGKLNSILNDIRQDHDDELSNIRQFISIDTEDALLSDDSASQFADAIRDELGGIHDAISEAIKQSTDSLDKYPRDQLDSAQEKIFDSDAQTIDERVSSYQDARINLEAIRPQVERLDDFNELREVPDRNQIGNISEAIEDFNDLREEGTISRFGVERKRTYYLEQCLKQIREYTKGTFRHGSLYFIKYLLRAAYYYYRCVNVGNDNRVGAVLPESEGRDIDERIWYVPPNYFNDSGRYFELSTEYHGRKSKDKSVDSLLSQYAPFNEEYVDDDGTVQFFQPRIIRDEGESKIDFSEEFGDTHKGIKIPEEIELSTAKDLSGSDGQDVLAYSDYRFEILEDDNAPCPGGTKHKKYGKIYAEPTVETEVIERNLTSAGELHSISAGDVDAKAWIDSVDVDIQPRERSGSHFTAPDDSGTETKHLETTDTKFGYVLETQGIRWDLSEYIENYCSEGDDDLLEEVRIFKPGISREDLREIALNTAAHYLTLLIADVSGVNAQSLLYSIESSDEEGGNDVVYVFEQTEGGQGIVDHFRKAVNSNPGEVLRSSYEIVHNPQINAEYLFADQEFTNTMCDAADGEILDASEDSDDLDSLRDLIGERIHSKRDISYQPSIARITDEVVSIIRDIEYLSETTEGLSRAEAYQLKQLLSSKRVEGQSWENLEEQLGQEDELSKLLTVANEETVRYLLWSPDIDDCQMNLKLPNTIANTAGTDLKSYLCLEALLDSITAPATTSELSEMMKQNAPWARRTDDGPLFLEL